MYFGGNHHWQTFEGRILHALAVLYLNVGLHMLKNVTRWLQTLPAQNAGMLDDVKQNIDKEEVELGQIENQMKTGQRLVREKERKLRLLKSQMSVGVGVSIVCFMYLLMV